jgi:hypothetical protein
MRMVGLSLSVDCPYFAGYRNSGLVANAFCFIALTSSGLSGANCAVSFTASLGHPSLAGGARFARTW